tara:strand:+ start:3931 stop:5142 length:1212 start_codon:yes stop_codon:yes gene_type:complete
MDVNELLVQKISNSFKKQYSNIDQKLKQREIDLQKRVEKENQIFNQKLLKAEESQKKQLYSEIENKLQKENELKFQSMQDELISKSSKIKNLISLEAELEKTKRDMSEAVAVAKVESRKDFELKLNFELEKYKNSIGHEKDLEIRELKKMLDDQKELTNQQKIKLEQGSMQLQGEVQEDAIEEWLKKTFPLDIIQEIKKGVNGADCLQIVNSRNSENCGKIYYESKRTKVFQNNWISKFKKDMQEKGADIGVIVTKTLPKSIDRMGLYEGIYVCTFNEFLGLSIVLRNVILDFNKLKVTQENKGDKKVMLYDYVTSNEFYSVIQNLAEAFNRMNENLEKEKKQAISSFEKRRGLLEIIKNNIFSMSGRFSGIAGSSIIGLNDTNEFDSSEKLLEILSDNEWTC